MFSVRETSSDQLNNFTDTFFFKLQRHFHFGHSNLWFVDSRQNCARAELQDIQRSCHGFATFSLKNVKARYLALVSIELKAFQTEAYGIGRGKSSYQGTFLGFLQWNRER